jgi:hypothetical protein
MRFNKVISKKELRQKLGWTQSTFTRYLKEIEPRIKEVYPEYNKNSSLLVPKVQSVICEHYGIAFEEIQNDENPV